jgi:hypothetical protein
MKTIATIGAAAALICGISLAQAQNAPTTNVSPAPNSINKGSEPTHPSGAQDRSASMSGPKRISGRAKFCKETSANGPLNCVYASMSACEKQSKSDNLRCVANPNLATTGSR